MRPASPQKMSPSVLDSPRFFDEETLSAWATTKRGDGDKMVREAQVAAPLSAMRNLGVAPYNSISETLLPNKTRAINGDPIGIELVRGLHGPNDETWSVVVDGILQKEGFSSFRRDPENNRKFICTLPPGVDKEIDDTTYARPLSIAIRLESEAITPLSAYGQVYQTLHTIEHESREEHGEQPTGNRFNIDWYRTSDISSKAVSTPYPVWVPPHTALGIISYKQENRRREQRFWTSVFNSVVGLANGLTEAVEMGRNRAYAEFTQEQLTQNYSASIFNYFTKVNNLVSEDDEDKIKLRITKSKLVSRPTKGGKKITPLSYPDEAKLKDDDSLKTGLFVIGGNSSCAVKDMTRYFEIFTQVCEEIKKELLEAEKLGLLGTYFNDNDLRKFIQLMRAYLHVNVKDVKALVFFDALFNAKPNPSVSALLRNQTEQTIASGSSTPGPRSFALHYIYSNCNDNSGKISNVQRLLGASETDRDAFMKEYGKGTGIDDDKDAKSLSEDNRDYAFVYDRFQWKTRNQTLVEKSIHVFVKEFDDSMPYEFVFQSSKYDGINAHAVYTDAVEKVDKLDDAASKFLNCMVLAYDEKETTILKAIKRAANTKIPNPVKKLGKNISSSLIHDKFVRGTATTMVQAFSGGLKKIIGDDTDLKGPFNIDICNLQDRIAEIRLVSRLVIPIVDKENDPHIQIQQISKRVADEIQRSNILSTDSSDTTKPKDGDPPSTFDLEDPQKFAQRLTAHAKEVYSDCGEQMYNYLEQQEMDRQSLSDVYLQEDEDDLSVLDEKPVFIIRELPQIVLSSPPITFQWHQYLYTFPNYKLIKKLGGSNKLKLTASALVGLAMGAWTFVRSSQAYKTESEALENEARVNELKSAMAIGFSFFSNRGVAASWLSVPVTVILQSPIFPMALDSLASAFPQLGSAIKAADTLKEIAPVVLSLRTAYLVTEGIFGASTTWNLRSEERYEKYQQIQNKLLGTPIKSCISNGMACMNGFRSQTEKVQQKLFGIQVQSGIAYNQANGERFIFRQIYYASEEIVDVIEIGFPLIHTNDDWVNVPNSNSLSLLPPESVFYKLYEAEQMRSIHMHKYETIVGGRNSAPYSVRTPSEIAAQSVILETRQVVRRWRKDITGEHLMQSELELVFGLLNRSMEMIKLVYGSSGGTVLVSGDDILWTCLRSGSFSRLALRHLPLFQSMMLQRDRGIKPFQTYYKMPRRKMMLEFVDAMARETQRLKQNSTIPMFTQVIEIRDLARHVAMSFEKVIAMMNQNATVPQIQSALVMVASAAAHDLLVVRTDKHGIQAGLGKFRFSIFDELNKVMSEAKEKKEARSVSIQEALVYKSYKDVVKTNGWAARRVDLPEMKEFEFGKSKPSVDDITATLAETNITSAGATFYCPMGDTVENAPVPTPFMVQALSRRTVEMNDLKTALQQVQESLKKLQDDPSASDDSLYVLDSYSNERFPTGAARHPLAIQATRNKRVLVHLSELGVDNDDSVIESSEMFGRPSDAEIHSVEIPGVGMYILDYILDGSVDHELIRTRMLTARRVGFDAERFMFGIKLCRSIGPSSTKPLVVKLRSVEQVLSFAIGASLAYKWYDFDVYDYVVLVEDVAAATRALEYLRDKVESALSVGVTTYLLSEVAVCL